MKTLKLLFQGKMSKALFIMMMLFATAQTISAQLPSFKLKTIDGKTVSTDTLRNDGKPFIISFFATWCKPCNRELSAIAEVYDEWQKETGYDDIALDASAQGDLVVVVVVLLCHQGRCGERGGKGEYEFSFHILRLLPTPRAWVFFFFFWDGMLPCGA